LVQTGDCLLLQPVSTAAVATNPAPSTARRGRDTATMMTRLRPPR
jgi:hypothetical protein